MQLTRIKIENFKSIQELDFNIKKYGKSYTTMLVGINESGKSNILDAMYFLGEDIDSLDYDNLRNQKNDTDAPVDLWFYFEFQNKNVIPNLIKKDVEKGKDLLNFEITDVVKNVYLQKDETSLTVTYNFSVKKLPKLFISSSQKTENIKGVNKTRTVYSISKTQESDEFVELTEKVFKEYFSNTIKKRIALLEPRVSFWEASDEYLLSEEDLNAFSNNIETNKPLRNLFMLAGYDEDQVQDVISKISNGQKRSRLISKLTTEINKYINKVWDHKISVVIDITETGKLTFSIKDKGKKNEHDRFPITGRSEGAKHFLSLILSLLIENKKGERRNQLILIDEPEIHLHPSGVRDLRNALLELGEENYVFISTHSPFLIDKKDKDRNIIIMKNNEAFTKKKEISKHESIIDDEVLREAFGIEVYRDLLNPSSILVEGQSDKIILQKTFDKFSKPYGVTNGHGSNIDTLAAKLNDADIVPMVILDDDSDGQAYKKKIIKLGGNYSKENVFTIRDLVGEIKESGTIEDVLGLKYVQGKLNIFYKSFFNEKCEIILNDEDPFIQTIKIELQKIKKNDTDAFLENFKIFLSEEFNPSNKGSITKSFPLLKKILDQIIGKLN